MPDKIGPTYGWMGRYYYGPRAQQAPTSSWWATAPREGFGDRVAREAERMRVGEAITAHAADTRKRTPRARLKQD